MFQEIASVYCHGLQSVVSAMLLASIKPIAYLSISVLIACKEERSLSHVLVSSRASSSYALLLTKLRIVNGRLVLLVRPFR